MTDGQEEAIAFFPGRVRGVVAQRVEVGHREHVGDAKRLGDVALALHLAHQQGVAAYGSGGVCQLGH